MCPRPVPASLVLAKQLIAAKLNAVAGAEITMIIDAFQAGDGLLGSFVFGVGGSVDAASPLGQSMIALASAIEEFNKGLLTEGCH